LLRAINTADSRNLCGHDDNGVGVIPENIGIGCDEGGGYNPSATSQKQQCQQGKNAAEKEVNI